MNDVSDWKWIGFVLMLGTGCLVSYYGGRSEGRAEAVFLPLVSSSGEVVLTGEDMAELDEVRNRRFCMTAPPGVGGWVSIPHDDGTETFCERRLAP